MITVECDSKTYSYTFNIDNSYTTAAHSVEEAKKKILEMIEDEMNAAINKKLDSSFVDVDIKQMEKDHEQFLEI